MNDTTRKWLFLWLLIWGAAPVYGQLPQLQFRHLTQEDGLSDGTNPYLYLDHKGYVWIASMGGINCFDGKQVRKYEYDPNNPHGLAGNISTGPFFADGEDLWFSTYNAIQHYVRDRDQIETYRVEDNDCEEIPIDYYVFHLDTDRNLWVRVGSWDSAELRLFNIDTQLDSVVCPIRGHRQYVIPGENGKVRGVLSTMFPKGGGYGLEVTLFEDDSIRVDTFFRSSRNGNEPVFKVNNAYVESQEQVWLGSEHGLVSFDPLTGQYDFPDPEFQGTMIRSVWSVVPWEEDRLFVSSPGNGLLVFNKKAGRYEKQYVHSDDEDGSLRSHEVRELHLDDQHNLWVSIWPIGLDYTNLYNNQFTLLFRKKKNEAQATRVLGFFEWSPDRMLVGTERQGTLVLGPDQKVVQTLDLRWINPDDPPKIKGFFRYAPNRLLILGNLGLYLYEEKGGRFEFVQAIPHEVNLNTIYQLRSGRILVSSSLGMLDLKEDRNGRLVLRPCPELADRATSLFTMIYQDENGEVLLAENAEQLLVYRESDGRLVFEKTLPDIGFCRSVLEQEDTLWAATSNGLVQILKEEFTTRQLTESRDGLPAEFFYGVLADPGGHLWLSSNRGLIRFHPEEKTYFRFTKADGLSSNAFNNYAWYQDKAGRMWFGSIDGLVVFDPLAIQPSPFLPEVEITQVAVNGEPIDTAGLGLQQGRRLVLNYGDNTVSFDFRATEFSVRELNQYQYQLVGYEEQWVRSGTYGAARYPELPPGEYTFRVKTTNVDGIWNDDYAEIAFRIRRPWYLTIYAYIGYALILVGVPFWIHRQRLRRALEMERMRVKISSDLHDDVGTTLSGLAMQAEVLEMTAPEADKPKFQRLSEQARSAMSRMRDTVWAIDARKDKLENLIDRIREHAEETLTPKNIEYQIEIEKVNQRKNIPSDIRQNLYLISKEALTNVAKHSNASRVVIVLRKTGPAFEMSIRDNGRVTQKKYKTTGLGLSNMQMRAEQIGATLEVDTHSGFGIELRMKTFV